MRAGDEWGCRTGVGCRLTRGGAVVQRGVVCFLRWLMDLDSVLGDSRFGRTVRQARVYVTSSVLTPKNTRLECTLIWCIRSRLFPPPLASCLFPVSPSLFPFFPTPNPSWSTRLFSYMFSHCIRQTYVVPPAKEASGKPKA